MCVCVCVCVCVCERERERGTDRQTDRQEDVERDRHGERERLYQEVKKERRKHNNTLQLFVTEPNATEPTTEDADVPEDTHEAATEREFSTYVCKKKKR